MAKKLISPGVLTNEIDASFLPSAIATIGAAVVGPALKGPVLNPTIINNPRELENTFGGTFLSGSNQYEYLTTITAKKILNTKGPILFTRVASGSYGSAVNGTLTESEITGSLRGFGKTLTSDSGSILTSVDNDVVGTGAGGVVATGSFTLAGGLYHSPAGTQASMSIGNANFIFTTASSDVTSGTTIFVNSGSNVTATALNFIDAINNSGSFHGLTLTASAAAGNVQLTSSVQGNMTNGVHASRWYNGVSPSQLTSNLLMVTSSGDTALFSAVKQMGGGRDNDSHLKVPFKLHTLSIGDSANSRTGLTTTTLRSDGTLKEGDSNNVRWEIQEVDVSTGTFSLLIRQGNDSHTRPIILEKFNNLSLDSTQPNYIERQVGTQETTLEGSGTTTPYVKVSGDFPNKSKFVRVSDVIPTPNYLDENGNITKPEASASLPAVGSGSLGGGFINGSDGEVVHPQNFFDNITSTNTQGLNPLAETGATPFEDAINLLANQDEYDINLLYLPGLTSADHSELITKALDMCETRGDCFAVIDPVLYGSGISQVTTEGTKFNSSYGSMYWPWIQIADSTDTFRWVPGSVGAAEVFAFNDKTKHPWFAPAGLNRGGINAIQAERKLLQSTRDTLYRNRINPIATFPGQGVTIFGQKTLQKKSSALDRVNVRRLLIAVKKFIASSSRFLLFEQNTQALRKEFLAIVNPFLEKVQSKSGVNAFKVVMDDTNNTPDTIDRNQLIGNIFLQPTKTAEFIMIDFVIQRTGAEFSE